MMSDKIIVGILQCIFSCSPTAHLKAALCKSSNTTIMVEIQTLHHSNRLLNSQSILDHGRLPHKQIHVSTNLSLAVLQTWQYLAPAAASGPSPKHIQNSNHYYITMTSLLQSLRSGEFKPIQLCDYASIVKNFNKSNFLGLDLCKRPCKYWSQLPSSWRFNCAVDIPPRVGRLVH